MGEGLAGEAALRAGPDGRRCAAVLRTLLEGQETVEKAEDGGPLRGAPPEAQRRHGEQDRTAAAQNKRAGTTDGAVPPAVGAGGWNLL